MSETAQADSLAISLVSEIATVDQLMKGRLARALPKGMELSHFTVLDYLSRTRDERTPAQLSRTFHVTKAAMTNTLGKLERAGYVHIRPDWDDARRKYVAISPAGERARDQAIRAVAPVFEDIVDELGGDTIRAGLPLLRRLRVHLSDES